jgi:hypothetical protein
MIRDLKILIILLNLRFFKCFSNSEENHTITSFNEHRTTNNNISKFVDEMKDLQKNF